MTHLSHLLQASSHDRFNKDTARQLRTLTQKSIVNNDSTVSIQIAQTISQIELLNSQIDRVEAEMVEIMKFNDSIIMTTPRIGYINCGMILGEIGDIHRFSKPHQQLAYADLNPSVHQSGNFNASHTRMSKRGSKVLRYALMNAAHNVVKNNATYKAYYDRKMQKPIPLQRPQALCRQTCPCHLKNDNQRHRL